MNSPTSVLSVHARSQRKRKRIEECFGWLKTIALPRKVRHRGVSKVRWIFTLTCAAYNLARMRNLAAAVHVANFGAIVDWIHWNQRRKAVSLD